MPMTAEFYAQKYITVTTRMASEHVRKAMQDVRDIAAREAVVGKHVTGRLSSSIYAEGPRLDGLSVIAEVGSRLAYAKYVELGTRPHAIFPKGAEHVAGRRLGKGQHRAMLKFVWNGRTIYTPDVLKNPGTHGKHFLLRALIEGGTRYRFQVDTGYVLSGL